MQKTIHVVEQVLHAGGESWTNKPVCGEPRFVRNQEGTANVIADHNGPLMCKPCLARRDPKRHRHGLLVGLPVESQPAPTK